MNTMNISKSRKYQLTIISSCYNSESYLDGFFNNIVQMDGFENFLLLICLNSPTVLELNIANKYKNLFPENIIFEEVKREFVSHSTNRGYRKADTEYIVYADVDDRSLTDAYTRMIHTLDNNTDCDLTYGDYLYVNKPDVFKGSLYKTDNFDKDDYIILKIDIEGAEYELLNHMLSNNCLEYINDLFVEFHLGKITNITSNQHIDLVNKLHVVGFKYADIAWEKENINLNLITLYAND